MAVVDGELQTRGINAHKQPLNGLEKGQNHHQMKGAAKTDSVAVFPSPK